MAANELERLEIMFRQFVDQTLETSEPSRWFVNLRHLDEVAVEVEREKRVRQFSEEGLEQRRDDVDVVPTLVVELEMAFALVDLETVFATIRMGANCCYF